MQWKPYLLYLEHLVARGLPADKAQARLGQAKRLGQQLLHGGIGLAVLGNGGDINPELIRLGGYAVARRLGCHAQGDLGAGAGKVT